MAAINANINEVKKEDEDLPELCKKKKGWRQPTSLQVPHLPPLWEINYKIPIIDENKWYNYLLLWCPKAHKTQLINKIQTYKNAEW